MMDAVNQAPFQVVRLFWRTLMCSLKTKRGENTWIRALHSSHRLNTVLFLCFGFFWLYAFCFSSFFLSLIWQMKPHLFINKNHLIWSIWFDMVWPAAAQANTTIQIEFHCFFLRFFSKWERVCWILWISWLLLEMPFAQSHQMDGSIGRPNVVDTTSFLFFRPLLTSKMLNHAHNLPWLESIRLQWICSSINFKQLSPYSPRIIRRNRTQTIPLNENEKQMIL